MVPPSIGYPTLLGLRQAAGLGGISGMLRTPLQTMYLRAKNGIASPRRTMPWSATSA